ncbi:related to NPR2 - nitrogen permease regulator [Moesziomyces antarcticus]|uniref:Related to NPR2 - nitrogen permease regulator n=1 Tax=Pseudozyma antarctica TaxID=84753 RepID=A0A5C3FHS0_PSEA2|nr:related to NPR2 - nitrogen permease regulator [Moesziomyces antarcticus]
MSIPALDEQFLPRLLAVFYAVFHPTEGPKVVYQVPEGAITEEHAPSKSGDQHDGANAKTGSTNAHTNVNAGVLGGEPLFDFSALSEYLIPKAPLCGRLVTSIARGTVVARRDDEPPPSRAASVAAKPRSGSVRSGGSSRASSVRPREASRADASAKPQRELRSYKILGFPTLIEDAAKYQRNNFIFNLCFVFEGQADVRAYEPVVRKCGRVLRGLEETQSFLSSPKSLPRMYAIIEQLFEDLSSYCESFVALPEAPYTSYLKSNSKPNSPETHNLVSPILGPDDFISLGASFASLRGEHHRNLINERLKQKQMQQIQMSSPSRASPTARSNMHNQQHQSANGGGAGARSRSTSASGSSHSDSGRVLSPLTTIRNDALPMLRSNSASGASGIGSDGPHSPASAISPTTIEGRRPSLARSSTIMALTDEPGQGAFPSEESRDNAMGIVSTKRQSELSRELSAAESLGNVLTNRDSATYDSVNTAAGTRRSSRGSTAGAGAADPESNSLEHLTESIVSLRTIDAALSNSVNALRSETADTSKRTALVERREPPHGLGRTVRDAINLKLFPVYPNPPAVNDWDVPVALLDLQSRVDGNWDLTLRRILPFIDGVHHVKRIAQLADADLGLTRACLEHLVHYGCIVVVDIFQYFNMYTVRPAIAKMADDEALGRECATYVTRPGYPMPSYPELLRLYSLLRAGKTLHDWIEDNDLDDKGIDVRRFVSFGVIQGFLRRVHRYPIYLGTRWSADGGRYDTSVVSTVRNSPVVHSPMAKPGDSGIRADTPGRRDQSGSREPRDRRPRELSGMSGAYGSQRIGRDGSVDSPGVTARQPARRVGSEARLSNIVLGGGTGGGSTPSASNLGDSVHLSAGGSNFGTSPTKRLTRVRRANYRHPTTTAMDVAAVAFQTHDNDRASVAAGSGNPRSPRKRASAIGLSTAIPGGSGAGGSGVISAGASGIAGASGTHPHPQTAVVIPPELIDMLDGLHSDDELCTAFSISWPELEKMLVQIGVARHAHERMSDGDTDDDDMASTQRSDWRRWPGAAGSMFAGAGASSGWSKPRMSGFSGVVNAGRSNLSGVASSGHQSNRTGTQGDSSGFGMGSAWGVDPDESGVANWASTGIDRELIEAGDLGLVRILYQ